MAIPITGEFEPSDGAHGFPLYDAQDIKASNIRVVLQCISGGSIKGGSDASSPVGEIVTQVKTSTGAPTHSATEGTLCWNSVDNVLYSNNDGSTGWEKIGPGVFNPMIAELDVNGNTITNNLSSGNIVIQTKNDTTASFAVANDSGSTMLAISGAGNITGACIVDEDDMVSNSNTKVPTQQSVKAYVDAIANGLDWKASCRVATTAAGTLATDFENGDTIDGVVLVTGDRILLKDQASGAENGIYTVNASGAPTRATDADADAEVTAGMAVHVTEGTANADKTFVLTTNDPITVGSTALTFGQLSGGSYSHPNHSGDVTSVGDGATTLATKYKKRTAIFYIENPTASDDYPLFSPADDITITKVRSYTDTGTVTFQLEERTTPAGTGVDIMDTGGPADPELIADATGESTTTFSNAGIDGEDWVAYVSSDVASSPTKLWIAVDFTID